MGKKISIGIMGLLVIGALVVAMTGTVLAQEETPPLEQKPFGGHGRGHGFGHPFSHQTSRSMGGQVGLEAIAEALKLTPDELSTQLWGGKTLADLAKEAGVPLEDLQETVNAALEQAKREAIEQAVEDGSLDPNHGKWLLEGLDKGYLGGHGCGGFAGHPGRGGFRGHGGFRGLPGGDTGFGPFNHFGRGMSDA
jgi:hypothetical protein